MSGTRRSPALVKCTRITKDEIYSLGEKVVMSEQKKRYPCSKALGTAVRHPTAINIMAAPEVVKLLREAVKLQSSIKLITGSNSTYLDAAINTLLYQAKLRGIVWNAVEKNLIKGNEDA